MSDEYQLRKDVDGIYTKFYDYQRENWDIVTRDELNTELIEIDNKFTQIFNMVYPIGSIYMSINNINPSMLFGGTWEQLKDRFLLGAGDTYPKLDTNNEPIMTDGEATHTLTTDELPAHTHGSKSLTGSASVLQWKNGSVNGIVTKSGSNYNLDSSSGVDFGGTLLSIDATHEHDSVGSGESHNNMPPYLVVYIWKRTA